jgi:hypothetical protein
LRKALDSLQARYESATHERDQIEAEMAGMLLRSRELEKQLGELSDSDPDESALDHDIDEVARAITSKGKGKQ